MSLTTREAARQYPKRWRLVEEREISELRETPIETKAKQRCEFVSAATTVQGSATRIVSITITAYETREAINWMSGQSRE
jgi:hypothetical protein